jgi:site-specific recombinase XerD
LSTRNSYRDALNIYWRALRGRDVSSITLAELVALDDAIKWPSRKTRSNSLIPLRQVFRYAVARGYASLSPAIGLTAQRRKSRTEPDPYSPEERDALLICLRAHGSSPSFEYFAVAFGTGMRSICISSMPVLHRNNPLLPCQTTVHRLRDA